MFAAHRPGGRFSPLLLEEGEEYVADWLASCAWPAGVPGAWAGAPPLPGRLRLATRALFFEPDDARAPIVRLPLDALDALEGVGAAGVAALATRWARMRPGGADAPYAFDRGPPATWRFELAYAALGDFMTLAQAALGAGRLPRADRDAALAELLAARAAGRRFDPGHLRGGAAEALALEARAARLAPLAREPGALAVSATRLYWQPLHDLGGGAPVRSHALAGVAAVARRRAALRDVGLEVFFADAGLAAGGPVWGEPSAFFAFPSTAAREAAAAALDAQPALGGGLPGGAAAAAARGAALEARAPWLGRVAAAWRSGRLSNFDYLLYLNLAAGRSFCDLSQYPVFPWVLADYTSQELDLANPASFRDLSKPVGALNAKRLAALKARYADLVEMGAAAPEPPFLYGTHYSCPGYVAYWLVRAAPAHVLRLQGGRFDAPDRLFASVAEAWASATSNPADVKELLPEFFAPAAAAFLRNDARLPLGARQSGRDVGDVELPPWAAGAPARFLALQRAALEAPAVSANLHHWIDLVFGCRQRGAAAVAADNVFRAVTYEGAVDPCAIADPTQRAAAETAIAEFGQCPRQVFEAPHPRRRVAPPPPAVEALLAEAGGGGAGGARALAGALVAAVRAAAADGAGDDGADEEDAGAAAVLDALDVMCGREEEEAPPPPVEAAPTAAASAVGSQAPAPAAAAPSPFASGRAALMGRLGALAPAPARLSGLASGFASRLHSLATGASGASLTDAASGSADAPAQGASAASAAMSCDAAAAPAASARSAAALAAPLRDLSMRSSEATVTSSPAPPLAGWGTGFRARLRLGAALAAGAEAANSVVLAGAGAELRLYVAGHDGWLRVFDAASGAPLRAVRLDEQPLTSVALLPALGGGLPPCAVATYGGSVRVFDAAVGRELGAFAAHADVASVVVAAPGGGRLATASWDGGVKIWDCAEGRAPWAAAAPVPAAALAEPLPGGAWALALGPDTLGATLALAGTGEGAAVALDFRAPGGAAQVAWRVQLCDDYVGGVTFLPGSGGRRAVAAAADGALSLLDLRAAAPVATFLAGTPLRCVATDGAAAVAGGEDGRLVFWDVGAAARGAPPGLARAPAPLGAPAPPSAVNALAAAVLPAAAGAAPRVCLAAGHESGAVRTWWAQ
jgi:factor associated with neutral sphingomyelinase activation